MTENRNPHKRYSMNEKRMSRDRICNIHPCEQLVSVCTAGKCQLKGAMCSICQVKDHNDHLDKTWNLANFIKQITNSVKNMQPGSFEMNQFLIEFKIGIREVKNKVSEYMDRIDQQVNSMISKVKGNLDQDIDEIKTIIGRLDKSNGNDEFVDKVQRLTQYFGIEPSTHKIYRKQAYQELYKWKANDLLFEQKAYFDKYSKRVVHMMSKIDKKFMSFQIPQIEIVEVPKFQPSTLNVSQTIKDAHHNWIRSVTMFRLSDNEVQSMNLSHLSQMAVCDPYSKDDLLAIVTTSDDMDIKIWNYSPEDKKFHLLQTLVRAHSREFFGLRTLFCDSSVLSRISNDVQCNNLLFTSEHGLIKIWDWVSKKCINEIKTQSFFTYDFELLKFKELGICFAQGSKNNICISDFTSPAGMLIIKEINPEEQNKDICILRKLPSKLCDLLVVGFVSPVLKIYNHQGICVCKIHRQDPELAFCLDIVRVKKRNSYETASDVLVIGSDAGVVTAFDSTNGKTVWVNDKSHKSWIRGLASMIVKDSYSFKSIVLTNSENDQSIKMLDGATGELIHTIQNAVDSGLRFRSMFSFQGTLDPKLQDSTIVVAGSSKGVLAILKIVDQI